MMKFLTQLLAATALLAAIVLGALHPDFGVLWRSPLALLGVGLIGLGLLKNAQQAVVHRRRA